MVQFIHLSLLLATAIQLPLVSVTWTLLRSVTVKFPQQFNVKSCCRDEKCESVSGNRGSSQPNLPGVKVTRSDLTIKTFKIRGNGRYLFYKDSNTDQCLDLKVTIEYFWLRVCIEAYLCVADCRNCIDNHTDQYLKLSYGCFYIYQFNRVEIQLPTDTVSDFPLENSSALDDAGLQFYQEAKSWINAVKHCQNKNSSLVELTNQTVQTAVNFFLLNKTDKMPKGVWIGLQRSIFGKNVPWMWISGSEAVFSQWNSSFPVDRFNNHCGKIIWVEDSEEFEWLDGNCHDKLPFICQGWFNESLHHNYATDGNKDPT